MTKNKRLKSLFAFFLLLVTSYSYSKIAEKNTSIVSLPPLNIEPISSAKNVKLSFAKYAENGVDFSLTGINPKTSIEFKIRKDQLVNKVTLNLSYTPSPSLIAEESHIKVFLNMNFVAVIDITEGQLGKKSEATLDINPLYVKDFNRLTLDFVGQYKAICPGWDSPALWTEISSNSFLTLAIQYLPITNDLAYFPLPFFDPLDDQKLNLFMVLSDKRSLLQQKSAAIIASWFGTQSLWRGQDNLVSDNKLPSKSAIVFLTNTKRPKLLEGYPKVIQPTIEMITHPENEKEKLLIIAGKDDNDLVKAVTAISLGNIIFSGKKITVDNVKTLEARKPYDAPNWIDTSKPTKFSSLVKYPEQLETSGVNPYLLSLQFKLPPDLYLNHTQGIAMDLIYRYSSPLVPEQSKLLISLNNSFVKSFPLDREEKSIGIVEELSSFKSKTETSRELYIPVTILGVDNQLTFDFDYGIRSASGMMDGRCVKPSLEINKAAIDGDSTIDFSNYRHYIAMPNLRAFIVGGFPYSRLADLSQTWVYIPKDSGLKYTRTVLNTLTRISAQTGYPATEVHLSDDWEEISRQDADILYFGELPDDIKEDKQLGLFLSDKERWLKIPMREQNNYKEFPSIVDTTPVSKTTLLSKGAIASNTTPESKTTLLARGEIAAIVAIQSPFFSQRTFISLLSGGTQSLNLLNEALLDNKQTQKIYGSVSVIRRSGVHSLSVGSVYYVGYLPDWLKIWLTLQNYPLTLAFSAILGVLLAGYLIRRFFRAIARKRLGIYGINSSDE